MRIAPVHFEPTRFWVESETRRGDWHMVDLDDDGKPGCSCHDFMCRDRTCKHIEAVIESFGASAKTSPRLAASEWLDTR